MVYKELSNKYLYFKLNLPPPSYFLLKMLEITLYILAVLLFQEADMSPIQIPFYGTVANISSLL